MKILKPRFEWAYVGTSIEGQKFEIDGFDVWTIKWIATGEKVQVQDPNYRQKFNFPVYRLNNDSPTTFAAGEFSNSVFGFYKQIDNSSKLDVKPLVDN